VKTAQKIIWAALIPLLSLTLCACATDRSVLKINAPKAAATVKADKAAFIRTVTDNRQFMDKPPTPDIPSIGKGGLSKNDPALLSRAVGRKRNSFGKAIGDVLLDEGSSVQSMVGASLTSALNGLGYRVCASAPDCPPDALILDVAINKYWSWIDIGFWSIGVMAVIDTDITISSENGVPRNVRAEAENRVMAATESAWQAALEKVLENYTVNAAKEFATIKH